MMMRTMVCLAALAMTVGCVPESGGDGGGDPIPAAVLSSVAVEAGAARFEPGADLQLTATAEYVDGAEVDVTADAVWESSDPAIAAFDDATPGLLVAATAGTVEVVAVFDGTRSAPVELTVGAEIVSVTPGVVDGETPVRLTPGETATLILTARAAGGVEEDVAGEVEWAVEDESIATIEGNVVTGVAMGSTAITTSYGGFDVRVELSVRCDYPQTQGGVGYNAIVPAMRWPNAYNPDGTQFDFGMEAFHCDPEYDAYSTMIIVLGAGWCTACTQYTQQILNPIAEGLVDDGALILYVEAQDYNYNPTGSDFAYEHLRQMIGDGPGIRVGDADTMSGDRPARAYIQNLPNVDAFPQVWIVRKRDMRVIADQNRGQYYLPLPQIVADPEADWSNPPPYAPPFMANCGPEQEEIYEPNDTVGDAAPIEPGSFDGGLCTDPAVDFYSVGIQGPWRITVEFSHNIGDVDMALWNKATDEPLTNDAGEPLISQSTADQEVLEYVGPADVRIYGYSNASAPYSVTLEAL